MGSDRETDIAEAEVQLALMRLILEKKTLNQANFPEGERMRELVRGMLIKLLGGIDLADSNIDDSGIAVINNPKYAEQYRSFLRTINYTNTRKLFDFLVGFPFGKIFTIQELASGMQMNSNTLTQYLGRVRGENHDPFNTSPFKLVEHSPSSGRTPATYKLAYETF